MIYILNVYYIVSRFFYCYNDIEKNYKKKLRKSKRCYNLLIKLGKKEFYVNFWKVKYVFYE